MGLQLRSYHRSIPGYYPVPKVTPEHRSHPRRWPLAVSPSATHPARRLRRPTAAARVSPQKQHTHKKLANVLFVTARRFGPQSSGVGPILMIKTMASGEGGKECRICFEAGPGLIAPCKCTGSSKWIHRQCLDQWRCTGPDPAFERCNTCLFPYRHTRKPTNGLTPHQKYKLMVYRCISSPRPRIYEPAVPSLHQC